MLLPSSRLFFAGVASTLERSREALLIEGDMYNYKIDFLRFLVLIVLQLIKKDTSERYTIV